MPNSSSTEHFRDRSLGLIVFGSLQILIGLACLALVPLTLVGLAISPSLDLRVVAPSLVLYAVSAAIFFILGVGLIRARRWARSLSLSLAWVWLIAGACTVIVLWLAAPSLWLDLAVGAGIDGDAATAVSVAMNLVLVVIYVLLPGVMVFFLRSPHVIATCHRRDPSPGWASRCPQRLLSLAVTHVFLALSIIVVPAYGFVFPCFGFLVSGWIGAILWAVVFILCLALAVGTIRREPWAWWTAVGGCLAAAVSSAATFARVAPDSVFEAMGLAPDQLMIIEQLWPREPRIHVVVWLAIWGSLLAYLVVVKPLFESNAGGGHCGSAVGSGSSPANKR